jgi:hypothetical protein
VRQLLAIGLLLVLSVSGTSVPSNAETPETIALRKVLFARHPLDTTDDPKWRSSLPVALRRYCDSVLSQVPRNTPQEDRWVDEEFKALSAPTDVSRWEQSDQRGKRMDRVWNSVVSAVSAHWTERVTFHGLARELMGPGGSLDQVEEDLVEHLANDDAVPGEHLVIDEGQDFKRDWLE